jgi:hypothetical protein
MQKSPARSRLVPVVYGGVIVLLVVLAVFARGFSQNVGDARVAGRYTMFPLFSSRAPQQVTVSWNGIALRFSASTTPALRGFESVGAAADLLFDGDTRLRLVAGSDSGGSLFLSAMAGPSGSALVIPYSVTGMLQETPAGSALAWQRAGRTFLLTLPSGATLDTQARTLSLPAGSNLQATLAPAGVSATAMAVRAAPARAPAQSASRIPDEKSMPSAEQLKAAVALFADKAYAGWSGSRISGQQWTMPDGTTGFSEPLGIGLLAESIARGTWQRFFPLWSDALAAAQQRSPQAPLTLESSTYVGGIRDFARLRTASAQAEIGKVSALVASSDNALLAVPRLVPIVEAHGSADLLQSTASFLLSRDVAALDPASAVGLLEGLLDYADAGAANEALTRELKTVVEKSILPNVRSTDKGVFFDSGKDTAVVPDSVRCGALLIRAGAVLDSSLAAAVGRGLVASSLALADESGTLPSTLSVASGRAVPRDGKVAAEAVYAILPVDRYIPRETPLSRQIAPGAWMGTAARVVSVDSTASGLRIVLGFPVGIACNTVIQGIKDFSQVRLHGIPWHTDPTYFKYSDGWAFDTATHAFSLKITGRVEQEEVDILY